MLRSALSKREAATQLMKRDEAHYALGKANEAILPGDYIGDGLAASDAAKEALKHIEDFRVASKGMGEADRNERLPGSSHDHAAMAGKS
jgi:hypothetical protein